MPLSRIKTNSISDAVFEAGDNLLMNGAMDLSVRNGGSNASITSYAYTLDRWLAYSNSGGGTVVVNQEADAPVGFERSLKASFTVIDDDGSDSFVCLQQRIEGYNSAKLEFGTSNAKTITLSFYVKSSLTGTFGGAIVGAGFARGYTFQYTINSANTWERKTITIPGDTTTASYVVNNGIGLVVYWDWGCGSASQRTTANAWGGAGDYGGTNAFAMRLSSNVKLSRNLNATWQITGCQLEVGSIAKAFQYEDYGTTLSKCKRYYQEIYTGAGSTDDQYWVSTEYNSTNHWATCEFPEMRADPTASNFYINAATQNTYVSRNHITWNWNSTTKYVSCTSSYKGKLDAEL